MVKGIFCLVWLLIGCQTRSTHAPTYLIKVQRGDTLNAIAQKYGTTWYQIAKDNDLGKMQIYVGQVLRVKPGPGGLRALSEKPEVEPSSRRGGLLFGGPQASLLWPVKGKISSYYGPRWGRHHSGIDIKAPTGTKIIAAMAGKVSFVGRKGGYGKTVIMKHSQGSTLYAHCSKIMVKAGQWIPEGRTIALVGRTGNATGSHLHFEYRDRRDRPLDPYPMMRQKPKLISHALSGEIVLAAH